jgi:hypothetical protein
MRKTEGGELRLCYPLLCGRYACMWSRARGPIYLVFTLNVHGMFKRKKEQVVILDQ